MAFAYVLDPTNQYQDRAGVNNVHGYFKVYISDTDDTAVTYKDFNGTLNTEKIDIDNNGRAVIIADSSRPYRVEMYEPNGTLVFTQYPVWCVASGGGMTMVDIESTDGSVSVQKTSSGGITTYDLSTNPEDDPAFLDWIKCSWYDLVDGAYVPRYASGTMSVGARGVVLSAGMHYHVTATVRANKSGATPFYDNIGVHFSLFDGENSVSVQDFIRIVDHSLGLSQDFQVDADIHVGSLDSQLVVSIDGAMEGVSFNLVSLDAHRVYSGIPKIPDGVARQDWVNQNFQKKLVAGDNITIDPVTNVISSDGAPQVQADWTESDPSDPSYIQNKPNLSEVALSGNYNDLINKPSIPAAQVNSDWNAQSGVSQILNKPNLSEVATTGSYNSLTDKPSIPAAQVNSDWNANSGVSRILNKPNLSVYAEKSELASVATTGSYNSLTDKPSIPAAQVPADWNATEGPSRILNKPVIPSYSPTQMDAVNSGINSTKVSTYDNHIADTDIHVTPAQKTSWNAKEDSINKKQSIDATSTTDFPSSKAVADFVNSSVATNTANFLGNYTLTDLGLSYGATDQQIATALGSVQFSRTPTNNDYVYVEIQNPQTTGIDDSVERFKFNGTSWGYEYTLNNSTFTAQEKATLESGLTSSDKTAYDNHIADTDIHVTSAQKSAWNAKQDAISDLYDIRIGAASGATAVQPGDLATVAFSGSYEDLSHKPTIPAAQVNSDWNANSGVSQILNKPNLSQVAISGSYNDLGDKPSIPVIPAMKNLVAGNNVTITEDANGVTISASGGGSQVQSDWDQNDPQAADYIKNKPTIPAAQVNSDWNANSGVSQILNKPNLSQVAISGSYNDLGDKPTIPAAQVNSDWNANSGVAQILNKPNLAAVAESGNYSDLNGTPTIPTVDQTYDGTSTNAQSGVAVASALSGKEDDFDAGEGLEFTTDGQGNRVLQVEGPVDIVAGPGIVIDNPDGNTLRVSQATPCDETVIWTVPSGSEDANNYDITLSETIHNFEEIAVYCKCTRTTGLQVMTKNVYPVCDAGNTMFADGISTNHWNITAGQNAHYTAGVDVRLTGSTGYIGENYRYGMPNGSNTIDATRASGNSIYPHPYKIVGIKRVANN